MSRERKNVLSDGTPIRPHRALPIGAEVQPGGGVHFRVWAPDHDRMEVLIGEERKEVLSLEKEDEGYFSGWSSAARAGTAYRLRFSGGRTCPDPASRFQPQGPAGPSEIVDPKAFPWRDSGWRGLTLAGQVIYELHLGTFTRGGTWEEAEQQLPFLRELGITLIEVMPVSDFPGRFGWGYDGVNLFAPSHLYGHPDRFRAFVDRAHDLGLGVILDVVFNHLGPEDNCLPEFSRNYISDRHQTEWGTAFNFDGENSAPVREFFLANVAYWIEEFHLDGLRFDAPQSIYDDSPEHVLKVMVRTARERAGDRKILLIAENEPQYTDYVRPPSEGGYGMDALWNDDFHHCAMVALSGRREAYYTDYFGSPQEFISAVKRGFLFQGQRYKWQGKRRGTPALDLPPAAFVNFIQNHDQIANSWLGLRCHQLAAPGRYRALTALLLLGPGTPMLFQGQEFAASTSFFYFADLREDLAREVGRGRVRFLAQFRSLALSEMQSRLPDPGDPATFIGCKLDFRERLTHEEAYRLHRDLLKLRREDPVFRAQRPGGVDGAVLGAEAFLLRFFGDSGEDRLITVNLGSDFHLDPAPEPLLAPPSGCRWRTLWSSEDSCYGGSGTPPLESEENWWLPGLSTVVLAPYLCPGDDPWKS